jgi:hypothetical protein
MAFDVFRGGNQKSFCNTTTLAPILEVTRDALNKLVRITVLPMGGHGQGEPGKASQLSEVFLESNYSSMYCNRPKLCKHLHFFGADPLHKAQAKRRRASEMTPEHQAPAAQSLITLEQEASAAQSVITLEQLAAAAYICLQNDSELIDSLLQFTCLAIHLASN